MYETFYGLTSKPFQVSPDPAYLYWSEGHQMAFTMLQYGLLSNSPLMVITGEVGAGKTTLLRHLLDDFPGELEAGLISNIQAGKGELLEWVLMAFGKSLEGSHVQRFQRFQEFLLERYAAGKQVALIIDEAQNLGTDMLEELRMFSNINSDKDQILRIILVGQPELREQLAQDNLRQFTQRITADFHIRVLDAKEVEGYIRRRLEVAGTTRTIFPGNICELIYHATGGVPRLINVLCDLCLVYGYSAERDVIDEELLRELLAGTERNGIFNQFKPLKTMPRLVRPLEDPPQTEASEPDLPYPGQNRGA